MEGAKFLREFPLGPGDDDLKAGDKVLVDQFKPKDKVDVIGISKGRGFAGVVKRHHFRGGEGIARLHVPPRARVRSALPASRRACFRACAWRGHMGDAQVTVRNLEVIEVDTEDNVLVVKGAVPGPNGGYVRGAEGEEVTAMPTVDVVDLNNQKVGELELADEVFGAEVNEALLYEAVRQYQAGQRAGTHKTKMRSEVAGSGKKLWKQKGTGRARMGSVRSPIWRHGGTVHGPQPRDYSYKLPRKMLLGALRSALSAKVRDGELKVVQAFNLADHKTKNAMDALAKLEAGRTVLVVDNGENRNLALGVRNLKGVTLMPTREVNPYHLLGHQSVLLSRSRGAQVLGGTREMNHL